MGYYRAGFDIVGVDIKPQPHYPFEFHQADALEYPLDGFDAYHASPPCQHASRANEQWRQEGRDYPALIDPTRKILKQTMKPYVIENVVGAKLINPVRLTGPMFGLHVLRARLFETSFDIPMYFEVKPSAPTVSVFGPGCICRPQEDYRKWPEAMGIDWMAKQELTQAIPPAYTEYIGKQLMKYLTSGAELIIRRE